VDRHAKTYAAQVTRIDSDVGELVDTLKELGIDENTLIVFSGDNGSSFSPESEIGRFLDQANNGLRGYKRWLYEGALRQACFARWPGKVPAGRVSHEPWAFWDLMPTFVELSGATRPRATRPTAIRSSNSSKAGPPRNAIIFTGNYKKTSPSAPPAGAIGKRCSRNSVNPS